MSTTQERALEFKVGLFVLFSLLIAVTLIVRFGRMGEAFRDQYIITVEFDNASGLLKDSDVLFSGARIGRVAIAPEITMAPKALESPSGVTVDLRIYSNIRIPEGAKFLVGSSGLLGDRFVDVISPADFDGKTFIDPGAIIAGTRQAGMDDITREGTAMIQDLRATIAKIDTSITNINSSLLNEETFSAVRSSIDNFSATTENLTASSEKIDSILEDARAVVQDSKEVVASAKSAMDTAGETMDSAKSAADNLGTAIEDSRAAIEDARATLQAAQKAIETITQGPGLFSTLINDPHFSAEIEAFVTNLRKHGILFYKDRSDLSSTSTTSTTTTENPRQKIHRRHR